jgi:hypothetical protein
MKIQKTPILMIDVGQKPLYWQSRKYDIKNWRDENNDKKRKRKKKEKRKEQMKENNAPCKSKEQMPKTKNTFKKCNKRL